MHELMKNLSKKLIALNVEKKLPEGSNGIKNVTTNKIDDK